MGRRSKLPSHLKLVMAAAIGASAILPGSLRADQNNWNGNLSTSWADFHNWGLGHTPISTDAVQINLHTNEPVLANGTWSVASMGLAPVATMTQSGGSLTVGGTVGLGPGATYTVSGGSLSAVNLIVAGGTTTFTQTGGTVSVSSNFQLGSLSTDSYTISGASSSLTVNGTFEVLAGVEALQNGGTVTTNTLDLGVDDTNTGAGIYILNAGTTNVTNLVIGNSQTRFSSIGAGLVWNGGALTSSVNMTLTGSGAFLYNEAFNQTMSGTITVSGSGDNTGGAAGSFNNSSAILTLSGKVTGSGSFTVIAPASALGGPVVLSNTANDYSGGTFVQANGLLEIASAGCLGTDGVTVDSGGTIALFNQTVSGHSLTLIGTGYNNVGALYNGSGPSTWGGGVTLSGGTSIGGPSDLTISGAIGGTGSLTKIGANTLILSGTNTYSGGTQIGSGTIRLGSSSGLPNGTSLTLGNGSSSGVLDMGGFSATLNGLVISGSAGTANTIGSSSTTSNSILTYNGGTSTFAGTIKDALGSGNKTVGLMIAGGYLTLSSNNAYSGGTTINGGVLTISSDANLGSIPTSPTVNITFDGGTGGTLHTNLTFSLNANRTILLSAPAVLSVSNLTILGSITGSSNLTLVAGLLTLSGNDNYTGGTTISAATLKLGNNTGFPSGTALTLGSGGAGGTFDMAGFNATVSSLSTSGTGTNAIGSSSTTSNSTLTFAGGTSSFSGVIKDTLGIGNQTVALAVSSGTLGLSGANTYSGGTTVSGGELDVASTGSISNGNISVASGATFSVASGGSISSATNLTNNGAVNLSVPTGTIAALNGTNTGAVVALNSSNLTISGGGSYAGNITDNGTGSGALNIGGGNLSVGSVQVGALTIGSGNLQIAASSMVNALTLNGSSSSNTGNVDLNGNHKLVIQTANATSKSALIATLRTEISYPGYRNSGTGGTSTTGLIVNTTPPAGNYGIAVIDNGALTTPFTSFAGFSVGSNSILVAPEILGDADLNGTVDSTDLHTVLNNFGNATLNWWMGNFDGSSTINLTDLGDVFNNFGDTNPSPDIAMVGGTSGRSGSIAGLRELVASFGETLTAGEWTEARAYAETIPGYPGAGGGGGRAAVALALAAAPEPGTLAALAGTMGLLVWRRRGAKCA